jgi:hypothetical protein
MHKPSSPNKEPLFTRTDQVTEQKDRTAFAASSLAKRGISIGCKIDKIKLNLRL